MKLAAYPVSSFINYSVLIFVCLSILGETCLAAMKRHRLSPNLLRAGLAVNPSVSPCQTRFCFV